MFWPTLLVGAFALSALLASLEAGQQVSAVACGIFGLLMAIARNSN